MAGLNIIIPRAGGIGPIIDPLHSAGVSGYNHRYVASRINQAMDTPIATFPDLGSGAAPLLSAAGTTTLRREGTVVYAELASSADTTANYNLESSNREYLPQATIAMVARVPSSTVRLFEAGTLSLLKAGSGQWQVSRSNGSAGSLLVTGDTGWVFLLAQADATSQTSLLRRDATEATGVFTSTNTGETPVRMGGNQGAASKVAHIAESLSWPRILNPTERLAVQKAMKAKYSALLT